MAIKRRTAVVTGASRGIGRAIAIALARQQYAVWAMARSADQLDALCSEAAAMNGEVRSLKVDLSDEQQVLQSCALLLKEAGPPWVLVNNAGIALSASLARTRNEDFERVYKVNTLAPFLFCRELIPAMASAGGGRVINFASTAALRGYKYTSAYCASKHALLGFTRALAVEFATKGVTINAVCPGWTDTEMVVAAVDNITRATGRTPEEARRALEQMNPMGRLVPPEEVAELCLFLASDAAAAVTGAAYPVDAGETL